MRIIAAVMVAICFCLQFLYIAAARKSYDYLGEQRYVNYVYVLSALSLGGYILIFINTFNEKKCRTYNYMLVVIILMFQFAIASMFAVILDYIEDSNRFTIGGRRGRHADWDVDRYRTYY